jgi:hypothetical protein
MKSISSLFCCLLLAVSAVGCFAPDLPDDTVYSCASTADCGEEGLVCAPRAGLRGYCCRPTTEVTCNGKDDNCDGQVDEFSATTCYGGPTGTAGKGLCKTGTPACGTNGELSCVGEVRPTAETCNGKDDNCDGQLDEGFNLQTDRNNCGTCGNVCPTGFACFSGSCQKVLEVCNDTIDNDVDNSLDCADSDCDGQSCSRGSDPANACTCVAGKPKEMLCGDGSDNDRDFAMDCIDLDCDGKDCNPTLGGCICVGQAKTETACTDTKDNDGDGNSDCADDNCAGKECNATVGGCVCAGGKATENVCNDTTDNDNDGQLNCLDTDCNGKACIKSGGGAGTCKLISGTRQCN